MILYQICCKFTNVSTNSMHAKIPLVIFCYQWLEKKQNLLNVKTSQNNKNKKKQQIKLNKTVLILLSLSATTSSNK